MSDGHIASETAAAAPSAGEKKQKQCRSRSKSKAGNGPQTKSSASAGSRGNKSSRGKRSTPQPETTLPPALTEVVTMWDQLDKMWQFLHSRNIPCTVDALLAMSRLSKHVLLLFCHAIPKHLELRWRSKLARDTDDPYTAALEQQESDKRLEVVFLTKRAGTAAAVKRRRAALTENITSALHHMDQVQASQATAEEAGGEAVACVPSPPPQAQLASLFQAFKVPQPDNLVGVFACCRSAPSATSGVEDRSSTSSAGQAMGGRQQNFASSAAFPTNSDTVQRPSSLAQQSRDESPPPRSLDAGQDTNGLPAISRISVDEHLAQVAQTSPQREKKRRQNMTGLAVRGTTDFDPEAVLKHLQALPLGKGQNISIHIIPGRQALYGELERPLPVAVQRTLSAKGITRLFSHQAKGINAARRGDHVVISTSTSSGKSVVYHTPVLEAISASPHNTVAIYMFPTKALAQDQLRSIQEFVGSGWIGDVDCRTLDGDSTQAERIYVRQNSNLILTNPDMMHATLLPNYHDWGRIFRALRFLVIDEAHIYRGAFGAHVACVIRRMFRVCHLFGNTSVQVVCCSATLANPREHFWQLVPKIASGDRDVCVVDEDGSPHGQRIFAIWNPASHINSSTGTQSDTSSSAKGLDQDYAVQAGGDKHADSISALVKRRKKADGQRAFSSTVANSGQDPDQWSRGLKASSATATGSSTPVNTTTLTQTQDSSSAPSSRHQAVTTTGTKSMIRSPIVTAAFVLSALVKQHVRTLLFATVRKNAELVLRYAKEDLAQTAPHLQDKVRSYRAGYTKETRRQLERALFKGELYGAAATNALELGIDVGSLDATLLLGFPGSIASMWQQAGRSGRGTNKALTVLILFNSPLDQYFASHPQKLLKKRVEAAVCDASNPHILRDHLLCAIYECPLQMSFDTLSQQASRTSAENVTNAGRTSSRSSTDTLDAALFDSSAIDLLHSLQDQGIVYYDEAEGCWNLSHRQVRPAMHVSLRSVQQESFKVLRMPSKTEIDQVEYLKAFLEVYPGAIFLHQGETFLISGLDVGDRVALAQPVSVDYFTEPRDLSDVYILGVLGRRAFGRLDVAWGTAQVKTTVYGYRKIHQRSLKILELVESLLPEMEYKTRAMWIHVPVSVKRQVEAQVGPAGDFASAMHGANHALRISVPMHILCDQGDINTEHASDYQERLKPLRLVLFDTRPGGIGLAHACFERVDKLVKTALEMIESCDCEQGCPGCIHDPGCGEYNDRINKAGAMVILRGLVAEMAKTPPEPSAGNLTIRFSPEDQLDTRGWLEPISKDEGDDKLP